MKMKDNFFKKIKEKVHIKPKNNQIIEGKSK